MAYNPVTDFVGLYRNGGGQVTKMEMPGLDFVIAALARAGLITLSVSATAPVVSQPVTAWLQAAVPSNSAEGVLRLWDAATGTYVAATPALFFDMLQAAAGQSGAAWWTSTGGPPANIVGSDGDFAIRTDEPGGIYGPKAGGAWPVVPLPGSVNEVNSEGLDNTFGPTPGQIIYRDIAEWLGLPIGADGSILMAAGGLPAWGALSVLLDTLFGNLQGSVLFRGAALWDALPPGTATYVLQTGGPAVDPTWQPRAAEFSSGTRMLFNQTAAPTGWTKSVLVNDVGLRVTSGAVGSVVGTAFSTVFAQTQVGDHTLTIGEMPSHNHPGGNPAFRGSSQSDITPGSVLGAENTATLGFQGGGGPHTHSVNLSLSYIDVIIAEKN